MSQVTKLIPKSIQEVSLRQALRSFLTDCHAKNLSPKTTTWYEERLGWFAEFLDESASANHPGDVPLYRITEDTVKRFIQSYKEKDNQKCGGNKLSSYTVKGMVVALKVFLKYLYDEGYLTENLAPRIKTPKVQKKIIQTLNREQIEQLLKVPDQKVFTGFRNYCMFLTFLDTGIRLNELIHLKVSSLNFYSNTLTVLGKGNKERGMPFGTHLKKVFEKYLSWRGEKPSQDFLFVDQFGRKMKPRRIAHILTQCGKKAGITGVRMSPHTLRHTFAKMSILSGMDAMTLQYILGHTSLEMVKNYVNLTHEEVALHKNRFSLLDRMEIKGITERKKLW